MRSTLLTLGLALILLGIIGLFAGGLIFPPHRVERGIGPLRVQHQEMRTVPVPPLLGGIALIAGAGFLTIAANKKS